MSGIDSNGDLYLQNDDVADFLKNQLLKNTKIAFLDVQSESEPEWHADLAVLDASFKKDKERWNESYRQRNTENLRKRALDG